MTLLGRALALASLLLCSCGSKTDPGSDAGWLVKADVALGEAKALVAKRRKALWWPDVKAIVGEGPNPTFYKYGYLREANSLCFWNRERAQARNAVLQEGNLVPGCVL